MMDYTNTKTTSFTFGASEICVLTKTADGKHYFVFHDICRALEIPYKDREEIQQEVEAEFESPLPTKKADFNGFIKDFLLLDEPQLCFVLMRSKSPNAKPLRKWIYDEVIPAVRNKPSRPKINLSTKWVEDGVNIDFNEYFVKCAKNKIFFGADRILDILRNAKILLTNNEPYEFFFEDGYFVRDSKTIETPHGTEIQKKILITRKGEALLDEIIQVEWKYENPFDLETIRAARDRARERNNRGK